MDAVDVFVESVLNHHDLDPDAKLDSFSDGFALTAFIYGTDPDDGNDAACLTQSSDERTHA
jgi:hypothetical protein